MKSKISARCEVCRWKYSCGYSAMNRGKEDDECCLDLMSTGKRFFVKKTAKGKFWSVKKQQLVKEAEARMDYIDVYQIKGDING